MLMFGYDANYLSRVMKKSTFCIYAETKTQISCAIIADLYFRDIHVDNKISLFFLDAKFQVSRPGAVGHAIDPRVWHILSWKNNFPPPLIQEELVVSYWRKNGHLILVNCLRKACPGTGWLSN